MHLLVIVQNNKRYTVQGVKIDEIKSFKPTMTVQRFKTFCPLQHTHVILRFLDLFKNSLLRNVLDTKEFGTLHVSDV